MMSKVSRPYAVRVVEITDGVPQRIQISSHKVTEVIVVVKGDNPVYLTGIKYGTVDEVTNDLDYADIYTKGQKFGDEPVSAGDINLFAYYLFCDAGKTSKVLIRESYVD